MAIKCLDWRAFLYYFYYRSIGSWASDNLWFLPSFCYTFCPLRHRLSGIKKSNGTFFSAPDSHFVNKCLFCDAGGQNIENPNKNMFISNNKAYQEISNFNRYGCPMHFFVRDISLYTTLPGVLYYWELWPSRYNGNKN